MGTVVYAMKFVNALLLGWSICILFLGSSRCVAEGLDGQSALRSAAKDAIGAVPLTQTASDFSAPGVRGLFFDSEIGRAHV